MTLLHNLPDFGDLIAVVPRQRQWHRFEVVI
jgi:hypothetical protein